jgi:DNA-binding transcriptional MerR regulator
VSASAAPARAYLSIGEVLGKLRPEFPDVTISKIRFLESEGLVEPQRTSSGYRKFGHDEIQRLRYVLAAQRDRYLPLKVIREHLDAMDRGLEPPAGPGAAPRVPMTVVNDSDGFPTAESFSRDGSDLRLSREELIDAAGIDAAQLTQLESYGLIGTRAGSSHYDGNALVVAKTVAEMSGFGLEPRHLRAFKSAADREVGLVEQVVAPMHNQRNPDAKARAEEVVRELSALSVRLHAALVKAGLATAGRR